MQGLGEIKFQRKTQRGRATIREIQDIVGARFGLSHAQMISSTRKYSLAHPRQIAMFLCRELTGKSYPEIGRGFGDRDHTTILFATRKYTKRIAANPEVAQTVDELRGQILALIRLRDPFGLLPNELARDVAEANHLLQCAA